MEKGDSSIPATNLDDEYANNKTECEEFQFSSPNGLISDHNSTSNVNNGNSFLFSHQLKVLKKLYYS